MSENQLLNRLMEMVKEVQVEQKAQHTVMVELSTKFDNHQEDLSLAKNKLESLENKVNKAEGVLSFLKMFAVFIISGLIGFGLWVNQELHRIDNELVKIEHKDK